MAAAAPRCRSLESPRGYSTTFKFETALRTLEDDALAHCAYPEQGKPLAKARSVMLNSVIVKIVDFCARRRWLVLVFGLLLAAAASAYDVARFSITTDTENLIASDLPWRQRQADVSKAFPEKEILVVVTA